MWASLDSLTDFHCELLRIGPPCEDADREDARKMILTWAYEAGKPQE